MQHIYPQLTKPRAGGFTALGFTSALMQYKPHFVTDIDHSKPKRKNLIAPPDNNTFVKSIKQSFVKNPRVMPNTKIMLTLLAGWGGKGDAIDTTVGVIGKHLSRCRRQVHRYLQDAVEEGYITYTRRKDRIGRYIGIKIYLNFAAIQFTRFMKSKSKNKTRKTAENTAENIDVTLMADINTKQNINHKKSYDDTDLWNKLSQFANTLGYLDPEPPS